MKRAWVIAALACSVAWGADYEDNMQEALKKAGAPSVSVAVVQDGKLAFANAYGMADLEKGRAADVNTRDSVGSVSKQFTAAAILLAEEQGKLSLDDTVSKYFPSLTRAKDITI